MLLVLVFLRGLISIIKNESVAAEKLYEKTEELLYQEKPYYEQDDVRSFAKGFTKAYLTLEPKDETYKDRLAPYVASYLNTLNVNTYRVEKTTFVEDVFVWDVEDMGNGQVNVTVQADVGMYWTEYIEKEDGTNDAFERTDQAVRFLKIPIRFTEDNKLVVDDYPMFVPPPEKGTVNHVSLNRSGTNPTAKKELEELASNFFKAYFSGNPTEISYYLENGEKIRGFENQLTFIKTDEVSTYVLDTETGTCLVTGKLEIVDPITGINFYQSMHFETIQKDDRWYILNFDARSMNLLNYTIKEEE
jgi:hypothetical protein